MRVGEDHPLGRKSIGAGRGDLTGLRREAMNVPVAKIIAHDEDDVWLGRRSRELSGQEGTETERDLRYSRDSEFHGQLGMFLDATQSVTVAI